MSQELEREQEATVESRSPADRRRLCQWLQLHLTEQIGSVTFSRLLEAFGDVEAILKASSAKLATVPGIGRVKAQRIVDSRQQVNAQAELDRADRAGVRILPFDDPDYPPVLKTIYDPPRVLYAKGELLERDRLAIAIVGSRSCSQYGYEQAGRFAHLLASAGFTIVSGLARGIDTAAHQGALAAGGRTIAVQGCGLARVFPEENTELAQRITAQGTLLSELPLTYEPIANTFPARNRIIAGLSRAVIVIEARKRSGALITARLALEQNREVLAVPGRVDAPGSAGPHQLIKQGAQLIESVEDVMEALGYIGEQLDGHVRQAGTAAEQAVEETLFDRLPVPLTEVEDTLMARVGAEPIHLNELLALFHGRSDLSSGGVYGALTSLELKGLIRQRPGGYYQRNRPPSAGN